MNLKELWNSKTLKVYLQGELYDVFTKDEDKFQGDFGYIELNDKLIESIKLGLIRLEREN